MALTEKAVEWASRIGSLALTGNFYCWKILGHGKIPYLNNNNEIIYIRILFIDYNSAFNTVIPNRLISKGLDLGLGPASTIGLIAK